MNVFDLLERVRDRPSAYIGDTDSGRRLYDLELLLNGYALALEMHGIGEPAGDFQRTFSKYLADRFAWSTACGPSAAIREASQTDDEAWTRYFQLVDEFRSSLTRDARS